MERNEAIEVIKRNYPHVTESGSQFETALRLLIPELKESEDNKIKDAAIEFVRQNKSFNYRLGISKEEVIAWIKKQDRQKPDDKVEPKFHEGEWVVSNRYTSKPFCITKISDTHYLVDNDSFIPFEQESDWRLWDITKDAQDGDVLTTTHDNGIGQITFIFKRIVDDDMFCYCLYDSEMSDKLCFDPCTESDFIGGVNGAEEEFHPATKEQRDLLFAKMKEAGYVWDAEKKELKKIEQKPAWSEEDEQHVNSLLKRLDGLCRNEFERTKFAISEDRDWLESLRPQNSSVTDEELAQAKKDAYNDALNKIEYHSGEPTFDDGWSAAIWYLKKRNTQAQNTWKPSDEQMKALKHASNDCSIAFADMKILATLYEQLKALHRYEQDT